MRIGWGVGASTFAWANGNKGRKAGSSVMATRVTVGRNKGDSGLQLSRLKTHLWLFCQAVCLLARPGASACPGLRKTQDWPVSAVSVAEELALGLHYSLGRPTMDMF